MGAHGCPHFRVRAPTRAVCVARRISRWCRARTPHRPPTATPRAPTREPLDDHCKSLQLPPGCIWAKVTLWASRGYGPFARRTSHTRSTGFFSFSLSFFFFFTENSWKIGAIPPVDKVWLPCSAKRAKTGERGPEGVGGSCSDVLGVHVASEERYGVVNQHVVWYGRGIGRIAAAPDTFDEWTAEKESTRCGKRK